MFELLAPSGLTLLEDPHECPAYDNVVLQPRGKGSVLPQPIAGNDTDLPQAGKGNRGDLLDASGASAEPCRFVSDAIHGAAGSDGQNESLRPEEDDATQVGEEVVVPRMAESSQGSSEVVQILWIVDLVKDPQPTIRLVSPALCWSRTLDFVENQIFRFA